MSDRALGVAVVGAGYWGPNLIRNAQACPDVDLRWVCDRDHERAQAVVGRYSVVATTPELDQLLDDDTVDAVAIATPAATHAPIATRCLEAGKHVLIEKPLASSVAEAETILEVARQHDRIVMCDHTFCYTAAVRRLRELIHNGEIGDLQFFDSVRINLGLVQPDVDVFWDLAPHDLSILDFILPDGCAPVAVSAHGADPMGVGQSCLGYLTMPLSNGGIANSHVNWLSPTKVRTTIVGGSKRTIVWDDLSPTQRLSIYDRGVDLGEPALLDNESRRRAIVSYRVGDMVAPALPETEALQGVIREFVAAIREQRAPLTDGESGLRILRILDAVSSSLHQGGANIPLAPDPSRKGAGATVLVP